MIARESEGLDTKKKAILHFDHKNIYSQIVRNDPEIIQHYEIVGSVSKKSPQFNESCALSKDCSMSNTRN